MKVLALNCSPRKSWNTAKLLKSALKGENLPVQKSSISICMV